MEYSIVRSKRRSAQISINQQGHVIFRAPISLSKERIQSLIEQKALWIKNVQDKILQKIAKQKKLSFEDGSIFYFLGEKRSLTVVKDERMSIKFYFDEQGWRVLVPIIWDQEKTLKQIQKILSLWYLRSAKTYLEQRVSFLATQMQVDVLKINVRMQKTLWGSCHYRHRTINLNKKLIGLPTNIIDYVLIHELSHLRFPNHSKVFWQEVQRWCPLYQQHRLWLKTNANEYLIP